jgi:hypothetical protein
MSNALTYIPLERPRRDMVCNTHLRVSVYYYKLARPRGILLSVAPCEIDNGFVRERITLGVTNTCIYRTIVPLERGNARKEQAVREMIQAEIDSKCGPYWDEISQVIDACSEPAEVAALA